MPRVEEGGSEQTLKTWIQNDNKSKAFLFRKMRGRSWNVYQSKGSAETYVAETSSFTKNEGHENVREHMNQFFDSVDKLKEMNV